MKPMPWTGLYGLLPVLLSETTRLANLYIFSLCPEATLKAWFLPSEYYARHIGQIPRQKRVVLRIHETATLALFFTHITSPSARFGD